MSKWNSGLPCLIAFLGALAPSAFAQYSPPAAGDYPSRTLRFVVPFAPGGGATLMARMIVQKLSPALGQSIVIDNSGGAGGAIGINLVAKSTPDGYTVLFMSSAYGSIPYFHKNLPYDPVRDLMPITLVGENFGQVLAVNPSLPVRSVKELIALAKANPGKLDYGSAGIGGVLHLAAELFNMLAQVKTNHVPYKGGANAITDTISGQIQVVLPAAHSALPFVRSGQLRALGITSEQRWSELPNVPTLEESGVKGYRFIGWYGLWFPAGTRAEYANRIQSVVAKIVKDPEMKRPFAEQGLNGVGLGAAEFQKMILEELALNKKLAASIGIVPQ